MLARSRLARPDRTHRGLELRYPWSAEYIATRHAVRPDGLQYRTLFAGIGLARWDDIEAVEYGPAMKWFVVRLRNRRAVRVSILLIGLPVFAEVVRDRVSPTVIASDTVRVLEETAAGRPPSMWQSPTEGRRPSSA